MQDMLIQMLNLNDLDVNVVFGFLGEALCGQIIFLN